MQTISMKGVFWTHFVGGNGLVDVIVDSVRDVIAVSFDRTIRAIVTGDTTATETITGSVSATVGTNNTAPKRPDVALSTGAEIDLQNVIHKEVDSYANIAEWGSPTPT